MPREGRTRNRACLAARLRQLQLEEEVLRAVPTPVLEAPAPPPPLEWVLLEATPVRPVHHASGTIDLCGTYDRSALLSKVGYRLPHVRRSV